MRYRVWDEAGGEDPQDAPWREAFSHESAAQEYAKRDTDGYTDGAYEGEGAELMVEDEDGNVRRFLVWVDHSPVFYADEVEL